MSVYPFFFYLFVHLVIYMSCSLYFFYLFVYSSIYLSQSLYFFVCLWTYFECWRYSLYKGGYTVILSIFYFFFFTHLSICLFKGLLVCLFFLSIYTYIWMLPGIVYIKKIMLFFSTYFCFSLCIYLFTCSNVQILSIHLSDSLSIYLYIYLILYLYIYLSDSLSIYLIICISMHLLTICLPNK